MALQATPKPQRWLAARTLVRAPPSKLTCSQRSTEKLETVWFPDSVSPRLLLGLPGIPSWPLTYCVLGRHLGQNCLCAFQSFCAGRGNPNPTQRRSLSHAAFQTASSHFRRSLKCCSGVRTDTPEGRRCRTSMFCSVRPHLSAPPESPVPPLSGSNQKSLTWSWWAVMASASAGRRWAAVCGGCRGKRLWLGGPGGRWKGGSPLRKRPGSDRCCGVSWRRSAPWVSPRCPPWWWAAWVSSWTAVWTVAA